MTNPSPTQVMSPTTASSRRRRVPHRVTIGEMLFNAHREQVYHSQREGLSVGPKQRGQRILGDCLQWEANGQCSKGDNCSFRHDINKRAKMTQPNPSPNATE